MTNITKIKYSLIVVVFITLMSMSTVAINAASAPIVPIGEIQDKFTPESYNDWDYYVLPPDTDFSGVIYGGGETPSLDAEYSNVGSNGFSVDNLGLVRGEEPDFAFLTGDSRNSPHDFFENVLYPRAVRILSERKPEFIQTQKTVISLHNDYSTTFFAEGLEGYIGYFNTSGPFFLDIEVSNKEVMGGIFFDSSFPEIGYGFGDPEEKMTYPFIPKASGLQQFMIGTVDSTLITLTPHEWKFPTWFPSVELNTIFSEEFDQGEPWFKDESNDQLIQPENEMFSLRLFNLSVEENQYYRINTAFAMDEVKPGVLSAPPITSLLGNSFEVISGDLEDEGLLIKALETVEITLIMYSPGEAHGSYSIFYQEMPKTSIVETRPLTFNEDLALEREIRYTFTLNSPILLNTNDSGTFTYDIGVEGTKPGDWNHISDHTFIDGFWRYIPSGKYMIENLTFTVGNEIRFKSVPVRAPSALPLSVNQDSIFAIELPLVKNRINFVNVSTEDHINQSIDYSWRIVSKYHQLVPITTGTITLGNIQNNGVWEAWPLITSNKSTIREYFPTREHEVPILLIYPTGADNANNVSDPMTTFDGSLTIDVNEALDQTYEYKGFTSLYDAFTGSGMNYAGWFIPKPTISSTTSYTINSDLTTSNNQIIGIPLNLNPYTIYNITATLTGNYSTSNSYNVTFENDIEDLRVMGGDLKSLNIFGSRNEDDDDLSIWQTTLIMTVSEISYLYLDLYRNGNRNATLQIKITDIGATNMEFQINQEYNETISEYEVKSTSLLVKEIKPSEMKKATPGFELSLVFIALVISSAYASRKRRNR